MAAGPDRTADMEAFAAIVAHGSFSGAARVLGVTPSAVSRTVARIEGRLGVRLVMRTTRALALTPEGETYLKACRRILADIAETEKALGDQSAPRGRVRVNATLTHGRLKIVPLLGEFLCRHPEITVDISLTDATIDLIEERTDVAIRVGPLHDSSLTARRLGESVRTIVASPDYLARKGVPAVPEDLLRHNCIGFNFRRAEPVWPFLRDGQRFALPVTGNVEANNGDTVAQLAREGVGIARVGHFHVADDIAAGTLVPLLDSFNPGDREPFHALFVGGTSMPARVRVFIDYLAEKLGG